MHACWDKLPKRPLNGKRDISLLLNKDSGITGGSHVNFSCNPFFELHGRRQIRCIDGRWESDVPTCLLSKNICTIKPTEKSISSNAQLIGMLKNEIKIEDTASRPGHTKKLIAYTQASFACLPGYTFQQAWQKRTETKILSNIQVTYQNFSCVGEERWEHVPNCIKD
jgi:hypothetical protein